MVRHVDVGASRQAGMAQAEAGQQSRERNDGPHAFVGERAIFSRDAQRRALSAATRCGHRVGQPAQRR